jgi:twinkle protein
MEITHQPCPDVEGCGSSDAYSWNDAKDTGYCQSCELKTWKFKGNLWSKRGNGKGAMMKEYEGGHNDAGSVCSHDDGFTAVGTKEVVPVGGSFVATRGITSQTMEKFGVKKFDKVPYRIEVSRGEYEDGMSDEFRAVYPSGGYKGRRVDLDKGHKGHFYATKGLKSDELFGMNMFPPNCSKVVTITEGEWDTLSAWQMLSQGSSYTNPVVSLPSASPSGKLWEKCKGWLDSFEKIILSVDNDDAGRKVAERISLMFPRKVFVMNHGNYKDANDFLQAGDQKAYKSAWWGAKAYRPDDMLVDADDYLKLFEESPDFEYFTTGIPELDEKILGINKGYFTVIQAPTGVGKTEVMRYLEWRCLTTSEFKFAKMHSEESKLRGLLGLVSYDLQENLTLKKFIDESNRQEDVKASIERITESERMIDFSFNPEDGYEVLLDKIKYMKAAFDVDYVFFEPIQDLVHGDNKEGQLADLASRLGTMATDLDVGIITIAHQNQNGDTMYATMIGKKAAFEIILVRDQDAEDLTERNRTYIKVGRKNRVGLGNGPAGALDFDHKSYTLAPTMPPTEPKTEKREDF